MQRLEVSGAVRPIYGSLGIKRLTEWEVKFIIIRCSSLQITRAANGPAITLKVKTTNGTELSVDLVPCLVFDGENLPANIRKKLDELDLKNYGSLVCITY